MASPDYYAVLGVPRTATDEEIKKAYRRLALRYHPDRNPASPEAEAKIREINAAYEIIGDPEVRRSYERLRFGDEVRDEAPDPSVLVEQMEQKLYDESRKEIFALLMKQVARVKSELAVIRERTVARQGYDTFREAVVLERAGEVLPEFLTAEMQARRARLLDVAVHMLTSQGVLRPDDESGRRELYARLERVMDQGRRAGFRDALELFYVRR